MWVNGPLRDNNLCGLVIDKKTKEKVVFVHGDTKPGSKNDVKLKGILGENWRFVCTLHTFTLLFAFGSMIVFRRWSRATST